MPAESYKGIRLGDGEEYELSGANELVHTCPKTVKWRTEQFVRLGFSRGEAQSLAPRRDAELRDMERWLEQGCTHAQAMMIVAPVLEVVSSSTELARIEPLHQGV